MGVLKYSINLSDHLLNTSEDLAMIEGLVEQIRAPMCPGYVSEKYPVNQKILNAMFRHKMSGEWGWEKDPKVDPSLGKGVEGDFAKTLENDLRVFVEVEFGNVASIFRDLFKFIYMKVIGVESYDVGVLIVPSEKDSFSKEIEGIYSFQGVKKILEKSKGSIPVPVLLLGIEPDRNLNIDCYSLEPDWYPNRPLEDGEKSPWKSQSDPFWDSFVERHADSLFPDSQAGRCQECEMDFDPEYGYCTYIGCVNDYFSAEEILPGVVERYVSGLIHDDEGFVDSVWGDVVELQNQDIDDLLDDGVEMGFCSSEEAVAVKDKMRRFGFYSDD